MGLDIALESEGGQRIDAVSDPHNLLTSLISKIEEENLQCLRFVDPYGDTVFNRLQMPQLIAELGRLQLETSHKDQRELLEKIVELARRCEWEVHLYLKFYGD